MLNATVMNIIYNVINLLVLFIAFRLILFKRVDRVMTQRRDEIDHATDSAKKMEAEAEALKEDYAKKLQEADKECEGIIAKSRQDGFDEYEKIVGEAKEKADQIITEARHTCTRQEEKSR